MFYLIFKFIFIDINIKTFLLILFNLNFRRKIKEVLGAQNEKMVYESHADTANKQGSFTKHAFMI